VARVGAPVPLFQSTPPRRRRRGETSIPGGANSFNPRLRAGGDAIAGQNLRHFPVSIHASAQEATTSSSAGWPARGGFNPRLRAGGDPGLDSPCRRSSSFNPRLRAGGDNKALYDSLLQLAFQSTPPRRRRRHRRRAECQGRAVSIHASAQEATLVGAMGAIQFLMFQSTPPRRRRLWSWLKSSGSLGFNPRLRAGGDVPAS